MNFSIFLALNVRIWEKNVNGVKEHLTLLIVFYVVETVVWRWRSNQSILYELITDVLIKIIRTSKKILCFLNFETKLVRSYDSKSI